MLHVFNPQVYIVLLGEIEGNYAQIQQLQCFCVRTYHKKIQVLVGT